MKTSSTQSLYDMLVQIMPELKNGIVNKGRISNFSANKLYSIWVDASKQIDEKSFRRPSETTFSDAKMLEAEGLISINGDNLKITEAGTHVIKQMILGDQRSAFDHDGKNIEYITAVANTKQTGRVKRGSKFASSNRVENNWYGACKLESGV